MKVEAADSTTTDLASTPSVEALKLAESPAGNVKWTLQDAFCAKLFGPWDNLPCHNRINEVSLLQELDSTIVLFEARIHHSDAGFRVWRERHKRAMEAGLADIPGFPSLQAIRNGKRIWKDDVWEQRYHYLVYQRHQIVQGRLSRLLMLPRQSRENFFGDRVTPPRVTMKKRGRGAYSRPLGLRCDWWKPLDFLLERAAERWQMNKAEVRARFWMNEDSGASILKTQSWESLLGDELTLEPDLGKENIEPPEATADLTARLFQEAMPGLAMHGTLGWSF